MAFRKKLYYSLNELQTDVNEWLRKYNETRPHSGKFCYGKTPMQTFLDSKQIAQSKNLNNVYAQTQNKTKNISRFDLTSF